MRLLDAAALLKPVAQGVAVRQALPKIIKLIAIALTTSVIASAVLMLAFYGLHLELVIHGYEPEQALFLTLCAAIVILILCVLWLLETLAEFKRALLPKPTGVMGLVDSFIDGLKASAPLSGRKYEKK